MKLYRVEFHGEVMVAAKSEEDAYLVADKALRNETSSVIEDIYSDSAHYVTDQKYLASGWDIENYPFGSDKPIKELL